MNALLLTLAALGADDRAQTAQAARPAMPNEPQISGTWQVVYAELHGQPLTAMNAGMPITIRNNTVSFGPNYFRTAGAVGVPSDPRTPPQVATRPGTPGQHLQVMYQHDWRLDFGPNQTVRAHAVKAEPRPGQPGFRAPGQTQPGQSQQAQNQPGQPQAAQTKQPQVQPGQNQRAQTQPGQPQNVKAKELQGGQSQPAQNQPGLTPAAQTSPEHLSGEAKQGVYILGRDYLCLSFGQDGNRHTGHEAAPTSPGSQAQRPVTQPNPAPVAQPNTTAGVQQAQHAGQHQASSGSFIVILRRQGGFTPGQAPGQIPGQIPSQRQGQIPGQPGAAPAANRN